MLQDSPGGAMLEELDVHQTKMPPRSRSTPTGVLALVLNGLGAIVIVLGLVFFAAQGLRSPEEQARLERAREAAADQRERVEAQRQEQQRRSEAKARELEQEERKAKEEEKRIQDLGYWAGLYGWIGCESEAKSRLAIPSSYQVIGQVPNPIVNTKTGEVTFAWRLRGESPTGGYQVATALCVTTRDPSGQGDGFGLPDVTLRPD